MDKTTATLIGVIALIASFTTITVLDDSGEELEPTHYCESKEEKSYCFDVRDYGDKINYRCLYDSSNLKKYYSCPDGWKEIPIEVPVQVHGGKREVCNSDGCKAV